MSLSLSSQLSFFPTIIARACPPASLTAHTPTPRSVPLPCLSPPAASSANTSNTRRSSAGRPPRPCVCSFPGVGTVPFAHTNSSPDSGARGRGTETLYGLSGRPGRDVCRCVQVCVVAGRAKRGNGVERKGKERKGMERTGHERKGTERKGNEARRVSECSPQPKALSRSLSLPLSPLFRACLPAFLRQC